MSSNHFADRLCLAVQEKKSVVCVGLDPRWDRLPEALRDRAIREHGRSCRAVAEAFYLFNNEIIKAVAPFCAAVKPQIAFYEQYGPEGMQAYVDTIACARQHGLLVIGDVKRGDIGSTSEAYAAAHLGISPVDGQVTSAFRADAITVNPYLGGDGVKPFIEVANRAGGGLFVLVKTSNPGSADIQDLHAGLDPVYLHVARMVNEWGAESVGECGYSSIGAVVGATVAVDVMRELRKAMPHTIFLLPGYGAQGVRGEAVAPALTPDGLGGLVNSSREIIFAFSRNEENIVEDYAKAAGKAAEMMNDDINQYIVWD